MMMNKKIILDEEKVKDFVADFNKFFEDLAKSYKQDAKKIKKRRECFWEKYPEIFNDSMKLKWILAKGRLGLRSQT